MGIIDMIQTRFPAQFQLPVNIHSRRLSIYAGDAEKTVTERLCQVVDQLNLELDRKTDPKGAEVIVKTDEQGTPCLLIRQQDDVRNCRFPGKTPAFAMGWLLYDLACTSGQLTKDFENCNVVVETLSIAQQQMASAILRDLCADPNNAGVSQEAVSEELKRLVKKACRPFVEAAPRPDHAPITASGWEIISDTFGLLPKTKTDKVENFRRRIGQRTPTDEILAYCETLEHDEVFLQKVEDYTDRYLRFAGENPVGNCERVFEWVSGELLKELETGMTEKNESLEGTDKKIEYRSLAAAQFKSIMSSMNQDVEMLAKQMVYHLFLERLIEKVKPRLEEAIRSASVHIKSWTRELRHFCSINYSSLEEGDPPEPDFNWMDLRSISADQLRIPPVEWTGKRLSDGVFDPFPQTLLPGFSKKVWLTGNDSFFRDNNITDEVCVVPGLSKDLLVVFLIGEQKS